MVRIRITYPYCIIFVLSLLLVVTSCKTQYVVQGPQGMIATKLRMPKGVTETDSVDLVVLMHGIFSSKAYPPIPKIAKELKKQGIATLAMDFGGHGKSQGKKVNMTIAKEIEEGRAVYEYACSLPNVRNFAILGHSQGGVVASMLAGELAKEGNAPHKLILLAPGSVIKDACRGVTTYRDEIGRKTGTSETNKRGVTTYRDNLGRKDGTAETKGNGTTYRDNVGRKQGSSTTRK